MIIRFRSKTLHDRSKKCHNKMMHNDFEFVGCLILIIVAYILQFVCQLQSTDHSCPEKLT